MINNSLSGYEVETTGNVKTRFWQIHKLFLSDICIVAVINAIKNDSEKRSDLNSGPKDELYALLRRLSLIALENDFMRPVTGILDLAKCKNFGLEKVSGWAGDHEWHRGMFTLYIEEKKEIINRIEDLISPKTRLFNEENIKWRSLKSICDSSLKPFEKEKLSNELDPEISNITKNILSGISQDLQAETVANQLSDMNKKIYNKSRIILEGG